MKIILVRHGEAERETLDDAKRQLTALGIQQAKETAEYILSHYNPDVFVVSPYTRAKQTLAAFTQLKPELIVETNASITPDDNPLKALHTLLDVSGECVVVVCHMPIVAKMAALLTAESAESYHLAEARVFEAEFVAPDMGREVERFVPNQY